jgi:DNA-binding MarR family transcriptional regulator
VTAPRFDELIHPSTRLSIVALLAAADWSDFSFVRDRLDLSDSALSKQLSTLEGAGYVAVDRPVVGRRRRVRARLTATGRAAFDGHVAALRAVIASADSTVADATTADPVATRSIGAAEGRDEPADSASR